MNKFKKLNVKVSCSINSERSMGVCEVRMINCPQLALSASREHYISRYCIPVFKSACSNEFN